MHKLFRFLFFMLAACLTAESLANAPATKADAIAIVQKAIVYMKANGREKTFTEINNHNNLFVVGDLYVVVYDLNGKNFAHGGNAKMIGKDLIDMKDVEGKPFMKERMDLMKSQNTAWQEYLFPNPVTKKIEHKTMYLEKVENLIFGAGIYK